MKVLISGAAGFIGSHLVEAALGAGHNVTGVDALRDYYDPDIKRRNLEGARTTRRFNFVHGDLAEIDLAPLLDKVDVIFHLAAQPGVRTSWGTGFEPYMRDNIAATQRLLEAARGIGLSKFVLASSSSVYGNARVLPTPEDHVLDPVSPYGATKVTCEHLARLYWRSYDLPVVVLRYFTVYGPRQRPDMAFHRLIRAGLLGLSVPVYGDGRQTRDFTYVDDAVEGTLTAAFHGVPGTAYNLGGGTRIALRDVIDIVISEVGPIRTVEYPAQHGDARDTAGDTTLARRELGYLPTRTPAHGIGEQVRWQRGLVSG
jgi:nucleoside-diphosphate-sugar epimerase